MLTTLLFHNYHYNYRRFAPYFRRPTTQLNRNWIIYGVFVEIRLEGACIILYHSTVRFFKFEEFQAMSGEISFRNIERSLKTILKN